jgi:hypothetical protein
MNEIMSEDRFTEKYEFFGSFFARVFKKRKRKETTKRDTDSQEDELSGEMDMHE